MFQLHFNLTAEHRLFEYIFIDLFKSDVKYVCFLLFGGTIHYFLYAIPSLFWSKVKEANRNLNMNTIFLEI